MAKIKFTLVVLVLVLLGALPSTAHAVSVIPPPGASNQSTGLEGSISTAPPTSAPSITLPTAGQSFTTTPISVAGLCSQQTVKIFSNNVFVGAASCTNGSYQLKIDLFSGKNDLVARQYDQLDQQSPDSGTVSVTFTSAEFAQFGTRVNLSSLYARRGADPGEQLAWPIILSGGQAPYAISVDWGDGSPSELLTQGVIGSFNITHSYATSGTYAVIVRATDSNGTEGFLQLIGVANGKVSATANAGNSQVKTVTKTEVIWWPLVISILLIIVAFWFGRRQQLSSIRRQLEKSRSE